MHMDRERGRRVSPPTIIPINFRGDPLLGILTERGAFIPLQPLVAGMGLDWTAQLRRVQRDPILAEAVITIAIDDIERGDVICLPLGLVPGFLFGIDASRVPVAVRGRVLAYRRSCYSALAAALEYELPTRQFVRSLRMRAAFWRTVSATIGAYLAVITLGGRTRRSQLSRGENSGGHHHG